MLLSLSLPMSVIAVLLVLLTDVFVFVVFGIACAVFSVDVVGCLVFVV